MKTAMTGVPDTRQAVLTVVYALRIATAIMAGTGVRIAPIQTHQSSRFPALGGADRPVLRSYNGNNALTPPNQPIFLPQ